MTETPVVLLDATERPLRILQQLTLLAAAAAAAAGVSMMAIMSGPSRLLGGLVLLLGIGLSLWGFKLLVRMEVSYKGHHIRFQNSVVFGERLYIDSDRFQDAPPGSRRILRGSITSGEGVGDRITVSFTPGLFGLQCRIEAEPGPTPDVTHDSPRHLPLGREA